MTRVPPSPPPTAEQTQPAPKGNEKTRRLPSEHLVLWLTLMAISFAALRILIVSRGDSDTLRALVQNLNVTAIVLATVLPLVTTVVWLAFVLTLMASANNARKSNAQTQNKRLNSVALVTATAIIFGPPTFAICWFAMPMKYVIFAGLLTALLVGVYLGSWHGQQFRNLFQTTGVLLVIIIFVAGLYVVIAQVGVWLPRERLTIGQRKTGVVYLLSADQQWTKYLDGETHKVQVVPSNDIKQRETITESTDWPNQTPSEFWSRKP